MDESSSTRNVPGNPWARLHPKRFQCVKCGPYSLANNHLKQNDQ